MNTNLTKEKRSFLLFLPVIAIPFLCLVFHTLGGGTGLKKATGVGTMGLNTQLPMPMDPRKAFEDKLKAYEQVEKDSARKRQYEQQDPYRRDTTVKSDPKPIPIPGIRNPAVADGRADRLLVQLDRLKQSLHQDQAPRHMVLTPPVTTGAVSEHAAPDPQMERLNAMLDKVIRIQHPQEEPMQPKSTPSQPIDMIAPADSGVNSIAAVIPEDQTLVTGATIVLRIIDSIRVNERVVPAGQLIYGTVTLNNDRMLIHIGSLCQDRNLYTTDLQVYDLDGLPGVHIPGVLSRDVAKQSADQGVNSLNVLTMDPSLGAQAAGAGIQAAKTFLGRKVRQVRVTVKAGYRVLLRNGRVKEPEQRKATTTGSARPIADSALQPPATAPAGAVLERCRKEGMELTLREVRIEDSCLWFGLEWSNHSPIAFIPAYTRWTIRDRRQFHRTAMQEVPLEPLYASANWVGFTPFALAKDKELVLEVGEKGGGRTLTLVINHRLILKAKINGKEN